MIKVDGLTRAYGSFVAVDDVSFECQPGTVTGFLGPNGAGKTTTMRVMVGLTPATRGEVTIGGLHYAQIPNPGRHVGVLLDASAQHAGRTGREVLEIGARTMGLPEGRVDEMLDLVALDARESKRRVRNYSLGMRQRLGIAHALLGDPSVLILDEPANGLDPAGIRWMRGLLRGYAERGGTVLLSSHLLHEVEQIADEMILIGRGKIVARGTRDELLRHASGGATTTLVTSVDNASFAAALTAKGFAVQPAGAGLRVTAETVEVGRVAAETQAVLTDLRAGTEGGLEDLFLELTSDSAREDIAESAFPGSASMSAAALTFDVSTTDRVPFGRLVRVELRKLADTRAGRWLLISIVVLTLLVLVIQMAVVLGNDLHPSWIDFLMGINVPMGVLLPVLGVLSITSEWSQRTAMVTFTLEPSRMRVVAAKLLSLLILSVIAWGIGLLLGALANVLYGAFSGHAIVWGSVGKLMGLLLLSYVISMASGFALGALFLNSPAGIVVYFVYSFVLPVPFAIGAALMSWFDHLRPWIDFGFAQQPLNDGTMAGTDWGHLVVSGLIWLGIPLVIGLWRISNSEVK